MGARLFFSGRMGYILSKYEEPGRCSIPSTGDLSREEIAALPDEQLAACLKRHRHKYQITPDYVLRQIGGELTV